MPKVWIYRPNPNRNVEKVFADYDDAAEWMRANAPDEFDSLCEEELSAAALAALEMNLEIEKGELAAIKLCLHVLNMNCAELTKRVETHGYAFEVTVKHIKTPVATFPAHPPPSAPSGGAESECALMAAQQILLCHSQSTLEQPFYAKDAAAYVQRAIDGELYERTLKLANAELAANKRADEATELLKLITGWASKLPNGDYTVAVGPIDGAHRFLAQSPAPTNEKIDA